MRSRSVPSRRFAISAALLAVGIFAMLAAHLDADPVEANPATENPVAGFSARRQSDGNIASARALESRYLANHRGTAFGIPPDAYASAVASMRPFCPAGSCGWVNSITFFGWVSVGHSMLPDFFIAAMHSASR